MSAYLVYERLLLVHSCTDLGSIIKLDVDLRALLSVRSLIDEETNLTWKMISNSDFLH